VTDLSNITPEQIVKMAFNALKEADSNTFNQLVEYEEYYNGIVLYKGNKMFGNNLGNESKEYMESVFSNLTYKIGDVTEDGDTAAVQIKISNRDFSKINEDMLNYDDSDYQLIQAIQNADNEMITIDIELLLKRTDGIWKIQIDESFQRAVSGGLFTPASEITEKIWNRVKWWE